MMNLAHTPPTLFYLIGNGLLLLVVLRFYSSAEYRLSLLNSAPVRRMKWYATRHEALLDRVLAKKLLIGAIVWLSLGQWLLFMGMSILGL